MIGFAGEGWEFQMSATIGRNHHHLHYRRIVACRSVLLRWWTTVDSFLVSFVVDARGAVMIGRRHSGLRIVVPPIATAHPTRVQCKLVTKSKLASLPPLTETDSLAVRVLDFGQTRTKFDRLVSGCLTPIYTYLVIFPYRQHSTIIQDKYKSKEDHIHIYTKHT